jgi:hypothetical protein
MHKNATKCNETLSKWCKKKHGASKIMDSLVTYQGVLPEAGSRQRGGGGRGGRQGVGGGKVGIEGFLAA